VTGQVPMRTHVLSPAPGAIMMKNEAGESRMNVAGRSGTSDRHPSTALSVTYAGWSPCVQGHWSLLHLLRPARLIELGAALRRPRSCQLRKIERSRSGLLELPLNLPLRRPASVGVSTVLGQKRGHDVALETSPDL